MSDNVVLPALGESVTEGTVTRWLKKVGDTVAVDEPLVEISTDKVDTEIPSPVAGVIEQILVQEDETAQVGAVLAVVGTGAGDAAPAAAPAAFDHRGRRPLIGLTGVVRFGLTLERRQAPRRHAAARRLRAPRDHPAFLVDDAPRGDVDPVFPVAADDDAHASLSCKETAGIVTDAAPCGFTPLGVILSRGDESRFAAPATPERG